MLKWNHTTNACPVVLKEKLMACIIILSEDNTDNSFLKRNSLMTQGIYSISLLLNEIGIRQILYFKAYL